MKIRSGRKRLVLELRLPSRADLVRDSELFPQIGFDTTSEVAAENYVDELVDGSGRPLYLDKVRSVSGKRRDEPSHVWDDQVLEEQHRRFLNAS